MTKSDKKAKSTTENTTEDVEMAGPEVESSTKKSKKEKSKDDVRIPGGDLSPIAHPLAQKKLLKKLHKTIKKASKARQVKRGVKEVVKGIRKGDKGLLILAGDINPIDIISHLPVLSEEAQIPYVFVPSKEELGLASATKRPTSCVMICPGMKRKGKSEESNEEDLYFRHFTHLRTVSKFCRPSSSMALQSSSSSARNGPQKLSKSAASSPLSAQTDAPNSPAKALATYAPGARPDKPVYEEEQGRIKAEIDALQNKLSAVRDKITLATASGPGNDGEAGLRSELNDIKARQSSSKTSRSQILDQIKSLQENVQKKVKDLQSARSKVPFRTVEEVDARIKDLEKQVESGQMKLVDEKRALADISTSKRTRRLVEGFQSDQQRIEEDRRAIEELKKQLDDPEAKAINDRYDTIIAELEEFKAKREEANAGKSKLFEERDHLQAAIRALHNERRESVQRFREANDNYWAKINEDRARREERRRTQREAEEQQRKKDTAERLLEEANAPAYQTEIEDCQTLIDHFSGKASNSDMTKTTSQKTPVAGVRQLELRTVDGEPEGVVIQKKGDKEESYFVGGKGRGKGKRHTPKATEGNGVSSAAATNAALHIPLAILSALGTLSIPPPTSSADVPRVIDDLKKKKLWLEANQVRATADRIEKAEAEVERLLNGMDQANASEVILPQETPAEPAPTPQVDNSLQDNTLSDEMVNKLDTVLEHEATVNIEAS